MSDLVKDISVSYTAGSPGVSGSPGQPYLPARYITAYRTVCGWEPVIGVLAALAAGWKRTLVEGADYSATWVWTPPASGGTLQLTYVCRTEAYQRWVPAQPYVAPTPAIPATPSQLITDYNLGWNAGARSIVSFVGRGYVEFSIAEDVVGAFAGLNGADTGPGYTELTHAIYCASGVAWIYEHGAMVVSAGTYSGVTRWRIHRDQAGHVTYLKDGAEIYVSALASSGRVFLDASLYSGGDAITNPVVSGEAWGSGLFALAGLGAEEAGYAEGGGFLALTGGGEEGANGYGVLRLIGVGAEDADYAFGGGALVLTGGGDAGFVVPSYAIGYGILPQLTGRGAGLEGRFGEAAGALALIGVGAEPEGYAFGGGALAMTGYGDDYEGQDEASVFGMATVATPMVARETLIVTMTSTGVVTSVFAASILLDAEMWSSAAAGDEWLTTELLDALMWSYASANSTQPYDQSTEVWVVNAETGGSTRYEQFDFNSFGYFRGAYYGMRADGLYRLEGGDDAGQPIRAMASLGQQTFGTSLLKRLDACYLGAASDGRLFLKVTAEGSEYLYAARASSEAMKVQRVDVGRGIRANFLEFEIYNSDGAEFELASIEFLAVPLSRRI